MTDSVLVVGAGELGLGVLSALAAHPLRNKTKIAVLLRPSTLESLTPEKTRMIENLRGLGVAFESGDVVQASEPDLSGIFTKYATVISCSGMGLPPGTQTKMTRAVLASEGVTTYIPWQFGVDYDIIGEGSSQTRFDEQLEVRRLLRGQSDKQWTIISTGIFTSFIFRAPFGVVDLKARTVRALGSWENRITTTTPVDIGRATAELVLDPRDFKRNQIVYISGDTISFGELASLLDSHFETKLTRQLWDLVVLQRQLNEDPSDMVQYRNVFAGKGVAWGKEGTFNDTRGMEMMDVREYLQASNLKLGE